MAKHKKVEDAFDLLDAIGDDFDISDEESNHSTPPISPSSSTTSNVSDRQQRTKPQGRLMAKTSPPPPAVESGALTFAQRLAKRRAEREKQDRDEREKSISPRNTSLNSPVSSSLADDDTIDGLLREAGIPTAAKSPKTLETNRSVSKQPTASVVSATPPSFTSPSPRTASIHTSASSASLDDGFDSEVEKITRAASDSTVSSPEFAAVPETPMSLAAIAKQQTDTKPVASTENGLVYPEESESEDEAVHHSEVSSGVTRLTQDKHVVDELLLSSPSMPVLNQPSQVSPTATATALPSTVSIQKPVPLNLAGPPSLSHPVQPLNQASVQSKAVALLNSVGKQFMSRSSDFSSIHHTDPTVDASPLSVSSLPQAASPVYTQPNTYPRTDSHDIESQFITRSQSLSQRLTQHLASRAQQPTPATQPLPPPYSNSQPSVHRPNSMLDSSPRMLSHLSLNHSDRSLSSSAPTSRVAAFPMLSPHSVDNYQHNSQFNSQFNCQFNSQFNSQYNTALQGESSPGSFISSPRIPVHDRTDRVDPSQLELSTDLNQLNSEQGYMQDFFDEDSPSSREAMLRHEIETLRRDKTDLESRLSMYAQALKLGGGMAAHDVMSLAQGKIQTQSDIIQQLVEENARLRATVWHGPNNDNNGAAETNGYHNASFDKVLLLRLASTLNQPVESMVDSIKHIVEDSMLEETQVIVLLLKEVQDLYRQQKDNNTNDVWQLKNQLRSMRELLDQSLIDKALLADSLAKKTAKMTAIEYEKERLSVLQVMDRRAQQDPRSRLSQSLSSVHSSISIPRKDIYQLPSQPIAATPAPVRFDADSIYASTRGRKVRTSTGIPHEPKVVSGKGYRDASAPLRTLSDTKPWGSTSHFFRQVEISNSVQNFHG